MKIQIQSENLTCIDLSKLLGLPVKQIATSEGVEISLEAKEADITPDHIAVIKDIYGGQTVELITEDAKDEKTITR